MPSPIYTHEWHGLDVKAEDGEKIGAVEDVYVDDVTGEGEFILVRGGIFGSRKSLVPLTGVVRVNDGALRVPYPKPMVRAAPGVEADAELTAEEESQLYAHYGMDYVAAAGGTLRPGHDYAGMR
ncbi:MAG TPA: PRC-barrel domain-containing protein [Gaiellales bacterium]|jgi:uncharacterized protein YrrD|nr:PRC-barrel domain-containing protein [Gaiellales bacterium]